MSPRVYSACSPLHAGNSKSIDAAAFWCARARSLVLYPHVTAPLLSPFLARLLPCNLQHDVTLVYEKTRWATLRRELRRRRTRNKRDAAQSERQGAWHKALFLLSRSLLVPHFSFTFTPTPYFVLVHLSELFLFFSLPVYKHA